MALVLNEEQQLLQDSAKTFLQECSPVNSLRQLRDAGEAWSPVLWADMAEMGWAGIVVPEEYDGLEFGYVGAGLLLEECGRTLASSPLLSSALVCSSLVNGLGNDEQKQAMLPAISSGELILTLALNESARFDPSATVLEAVPEGGDLFAEVICDDERVPRVSVALEARAARQGRSPRRERTRSKNARPSTPAFGMKKARYGAIQPSLARN